MDTGSEADGLAVGMVHLTTEVSPGTVPVRHFLSVNPVGSTLTLNEEGLRGLPLTHGR